MIFHVHYSYLENSGEIRRIKNINKDVVSALSPDVIEISFISLFYWIKKKKYKFILSDCVKRKYVFPTVPFSYSRLLFMRMNSYWTSFLLWILYLKYHPKYVLSEYSNSFKSLRMLPGRVKCLIDVHGAFCEEYINSEKNAKESILNYYEVLERKGMSKADYIICQSNEMKKYLVKKYHVLKEKVFVYRCAGDTNLFYYDPVLRNQIRENLGISLQERLFVYSGGFHSWQKVDESILIFKKYTKLYNPNSILLILTLDKTSAYSLVKNKYSDISSRIIIKSVLNKEVNGYLNAADVAFILRDNLVLNAVASPTKMAEYMLSGLPVISTSVAKYWIDKMDYVFNIDNQDISEIDNFLNRINRVEIAEYSKKYMSIDFDREQIKKILIYESK